MKAANLWLQKWVVNVSFEEMANSRWFRQPASLPTQRWWLVRWRAVSPQTIQFRWICTRIDRSRSNYKLRLLFHYRMVPTTDRRSTDYRLRFKPNTVSQKIYQFSVAASSQITTINSLARITFHVRAQKNQQTSNQLIESADSRSLSSFLLPILGR